MLLSRKHHFCIWCGAALWGDASSKEHIIPACLGGRLQSQDVCRNCNSTFGSDADCKLLHDESIYGAAMEAGLTHDEFLRSYQVVATTDTGREVKLSVRDGASRVVGGLGDPQPYIGTTSSGKLSERELQNFRGRLKAKVRANHPSLDSAVATAEVDRLFDELLANNYTTSVYSPIIGEGLAPSLTGNVVEMTTSYHPVDTQRAVAKSLFTVGKYATPRRLERPVEECLREIATFAQEKPGAQPVINHDRKNGPATRIHSLIVQTRGSALRIEAVLFGVLRWWVECEVFQNGRAAALPEFCWESTDDPAHGPVLVREACLHP